MSGIGRPYRKFDSLETLVGRKAASHPLIQFIMDTHSKEILVDFSKSWKKGIRVVSKESILMINPIIKEGGMSRNNIFENACFMNFFSFYNIAKDFQIDPI